MWIQCACSDDVCCHGGHCAHEDRCSDPAVIAVHLQCHFRWIQSRCSVCSACYPVPERGCSAHAMAAVSVKVDAVCCVRGGSGHEGGCKDAAVVAVHMQCHLSWMLCPCSRCSTTCTVPEFGCSAHAVMKYVVMEDAVPMKADAVILQ